jgi:ubiquinone/menaquinone biosynthesis C-methylase UbiE
MYRVPEQELMTDENQAVGFNVSARSQSTYAYIECYKLLCKVESGTVIDLGCGPGKLIVELAKLYPQLSITGVDASPAMIKIAKNNITDNRLQDSISLIESRFETLKDNTYDVITSAGTLHHTLNPAVFWNTIKRLAKPNSFVYIMDLVRPNSEADVLNIVQALGEHSNTYLKEDQFNSLKAAFTKEEIKDQLLQAGLTLKVIVTEHQLYGKLVFIYGTI